MYSRTQGKAGKKQTHRPSKILKAHVLDFANFYGFQKLSLVWCSEKAQWIGRNVTSQSRPVPVPPSGDQPRQVRTSALSCDSNHHSRPAHVPVAPGSSGAEVESHKNKAICSNGSFRNATKRLQS